MATNYFETFKDRLVVLLREKFPYGVRIEREDIISGDNSICLNSGERELIETIALADIIWFNIDIIVRRRIVDNEEADDKLTEMAADIDEQLRTYRNQHSENVWFDSDIWGHDPPETEEMEEEGGELLRRLTIHWRGKMAIEIS